MAYSSSKSNAFHQALPYTEAKWTSQLLLGL